MKKLIKEMLLFASAIVFIACTTPNNGDTTGEKGNSGSSSSSSGGNADNDNDEESNFLFSNYSYTDEVQLMTTAATITGSDDYNIPNTGVFPKGRTVTLSPFFIGKYEVTQELYEAVMKGQKVTVNGEQKRLNKNPSFCTSSSTSYGTMLNGEEQKYRPVEGVTWYDACYFCNAFSEKMGLTKAYEITVTRVDDNKNITEATVAFDKTANGYRLPTEAEWEYAARGGEKATTEQFKYFFSGATTENDAFSVNPDLDKVGWYLHNLKNGTTDDSIDLKLGEAGYGTHQVGKKDKNATGLYDMSGNVWEWCYDRLSSIDNTETITDPTGPSDVEPNFIIRGGCWDYEAYLCAVSLRECKYSNNREYNLGFRICRNAQ